MLSVTFAKGLQSFSTVSGTWIEPLCVGIRPKMTSAPGGYPGYDLLTPYNVLFLVFYSGGSWLKGLVSKGNNLKVPHNLRLKI